MNGYSFWNAVASGRRGPQAVIKHSANDAHRSRDVDGVTVRRLSSTRTCRGGDTGFGLRSRHVMGGRGGKEAPLLMERKTCAFDTTIQ
jgi:hypothetical protein